MKRMKQPGPSPRLRRFSSACNLLLALLVLLAGNSALAQQSPPGAPAPPAASQIATPAQPPAPDPAHFSATGAPLGPGAAAASPNGGQKARTQPAVHTPAAAPLPKLDPITHAPISPFGGISVATEISKDAAAGPVGTPASNGSVQQGMKMHGHWVINIRNPDGTLVQHHEFENALENSAQGLLVGLLSGYLTPGQFMIALGTLNGNGPCTATYQFCGIVQNIAYYPAAGYCGNYYCTGSMLSVTPSFGSDFGGPYSLVLQGQITANQTGTVGFVYTIYNACANTTAPTSPTGTATGSPSACVSNVSGTYYGALSAATLATPVSVMSGQIIQVTVTITFS